MNLISKKIFSKILLLSQLSSCVAIEIQKNIFENDWLFSKFSKINPSKISRYMIHHTLSFVNAEVKLKTFVLVINVSATAKLYNILAERCDV